MPRQGILRTALAIDDRIDLGLDVAHDKRLGSPHSPIEIDGPDQALEDVGQHRRRCCGCEPIPLPITKNCSKPSSAEISRTSCGDHGRLDFGQIPLEIVGKLAKKELANDRTEYRVAKKLETLIRDQPMIGPRGVPQGLLK